jgi:hypothetical protein
VQRVDLEGAHVYRERQLAGVNSFARELGFDPLALLSSAITGQEPHAAGWLDLCCGTGRALIT